MAQDPGGEAHAGRAVAQWVRRRLANYLGQDGRAVP